MSHGFTLPEQNSEHQKFQLTLGHFERTLKAFLTSFLSLDFFASNQFEIKKKQFKPKLCNSNFFSVQITLFKILILIAPNQCHTMLVYVL